MSALPLPIPTAQPPRPVMRLTRDDCPTDARAEAVACMSGEELLMLRSVGGRLPRLVGPGSYGELVRAGYELRAERVPRGGFIRKVRRKADPPAGQYAAAVAF